MGFKYLPEPILRPVAGVDLIEIGRIAAVLERHPKRFLDKVFTAAEIAYCRGRVPELAVRFAAKEAISKALGTGLKGVYFREMEIHNDLRGKPLVRLHGAAARRAGELGIESLEVSLSHTAELAIAQVVGLANGNGP